MPKRKPGRPHGAGTISETTIAVRLPRAYRDAIRDLAAAAVCKPSEYVRAIIVAHIRNQERSDTKSRRSGEPRCVT